MLRIPLNAKRMTRYPAEIARPPSGRTGNEGTRTVDIHRTGADSDAPQPARTLGTPPAAAPPRPAQAISKYRASLQFPKCVLQPLRRCWVRATDRGWLGASKLQTHVVVCGFPRSGSTLLQLMIEACVTGVRTYGRERRGLEAARCYRRTHRIMMTKRPSDIFTIPDLRAYYEGHQATVKFVLLTRDPRAVLTSFHHSSPGEYYVSPERWRAIYEYWRWAVSADDVLALRYEDLVRHPLLVQNRLTDFIGWTVHHPFEEFHTAVPGRFDTRALNGVRKLDPGNINRWTDPRYAARIAQLLRDDLPGLPQSLIELGYEADDTWTGEYCRQRAAA